MAYIDVLESRKRNCNSQIANQQAVNADLRNKIARLETAKQAMLNHEETGHGYVSAIQNYDVSSSWKGNCYNDYDSYRQTSKSGADAVINNIEARYNAIVDKINELNHQLNEGEGILGGLRSWLGDICASIDKWWNSDVN
jgi:hypothetical protein